MISSTKTFFGNDIIQCIFLDEIIQCLFTSKCFLDDIIQHYFSSTEIHRLEKITKMKTIQTRQEHPPEEARMLRGFRDGESIRESPHIMMMGIST